MSGKSHYVRILDKIEEYLRKINLSVVDWKADIFKDITSDGKELTVIPSRYKSDRPSIGLCGEKYFCEAGQDFVRDDTILIFRIEDAANRLPETIPHKVGGNFTLYDKGVFAKEDPVGYIFERFNQPPSPAPQVPRPDRDANANPLLLKLLRTVSKEAIRGWRPREQSLPGTGAADKYFNEIRTVWASFKLEKYCSVSPRQQALLSGAIKRTQSQEDFEELIGIINLTLLNALASKQEVSAARFADFINCIQALPLKGHVRAKIWKELASNLSVNEYQKELKIAVECLKAFPAEKAEWERTILDSIIAVAENSTDPILRKISGEISGSLDTFEILSGILDRIEIGNVADHDGVAKLQETEPNAGVTSGGTDGESSENEDIVQRWILQVRIPDNSYRDDQISALKQGLGEIERLSNGMCSLDDVIQIKKCLEIHADRARKMIAILPDSDVLQKEIAEAQEHYNSTASIIGSAINRLLEARINPDELKEIGRIVEHDIIIKNLPDWIWNENGPSPVNFQGFNDKVERLGNPIVRKRISRLIARIKTANFSDYGMLSLIEPIGEGAAPEAYLDGCIDDLISTSEIASRFDGVIREFIHMLARKKVESNRVARYSEKIQKMTGRVGEPVLKRIFQGIAGEIDCDVIEDAIDDFEKAIQFFEQNLGSAIECPYDFLINWINRNRAGISAKTTPAASHNVKFELDHCLFDHPARKVALMYSAFPNEEGKYGYFLAPILLSSPYKPDDISLRVEYDIQSNLHTAWPQIWQEAQPTELNLKPGDWTKKEDAYIHVFRAKIPIRPPKDRRTKIPVNIKLVNASTNEAAAEKILSWETIETAQEKITLNWPDGIQPEYVDEHPIGPQEHVDSIISRLQGGGSFAIVAPRRFGKTTMAKYIQRKADELNLIIPEPIICTHHKLLVDGHVSLTKVWSRVSENLQQLLGSSLILDEGEPVPGDRSFDYVRRAAKQLGKKGILLLFDEAQLLFGTKQGFAIGTRIKDQLEGNWSVRESDKVPVLLGLIGLPGLLRMGPNLQGLLIPKDIRSFRESNLNKLIKKFTHDRLYTTREARERLSQKSGNLFTLKQLLYELVVHANDDGRNWIAHDDVDHVISDMKDRLIENREPVIANYLRDIFNEEENIDLWKPKPQYPCAVALAKATKEVKFDPEGIQEKVFNILNEWCASIVTDDRKKLIYTEARIREHLSELEEMGIYQRARGFTSDILQAWLSGIAFNFPLDDKDKESLFRGALESIKLPEVKVKVDSGGQATIYRFTDNGVSYGLREIELRDQKDRERFYETAEILKSLQQKISLREDGSEFIYNLKEIGIVDAENTSDSKNLIAAEIYQWVEGESLAEKLGSLSAAITTEIGFKLCKALHFLHRNDIIHRDVCPRNVILEATSLNPVLIDFGISKFGKSGSDTVINTDYTAPENLTRNTKWSYPADIYSLGKTLHAILNSSDPTKPKLDDVILSCTDPDPAKRPAAETLIETFSGLCKLMNIEAKKADFLSHVSKLIEADSDKEWYKKAVAKFWPRLASIALGIQESAFERCAEAAQLIDFILEAYPRERLKLSVVFNRETESIPNILKGKQSIEFLQNLRFERSHFDRKKSKPGIMRKFNHPDDSQMISWAIEGGELTGKALGLNSLNLLIRRILEHGMEV